MSENIERPPLGVKPRYLAAEERYHELLNVISASWAAGYEPDPAWVEEAWEMCQQVSRTTDNRFGRLFKFGGGRLFKFGGKTMRPD